jgi:putative acetyltransferase
VEFRLEQPNDCDAINALITAAFARPDEATLVNSLRQNGGLKISAIAVDGATVVAHVGFSPVQIGGHTTELPVLALAPVAVLPSHQKQGLGSALCRWAIDLCRERRVPGVIVLGEPEFYGRLGFTPAGPLGIECPFDVPGEYFMALETTPGALRNIRGRLAYRPEFDALT